jgi:hypothetical protein
MDDQRKHSKMEGYLPGQTIFNEKFMKIQNTSSKGKLFFQKAFEYNY